MLQPTWDSNGPFLAQERFTGQRWDADTCHVGCSHLELVLLILLQVRHLGDKDTKGLSFAHSAHLMSDWNEFFISTHPVGPLADSLDVGLVPLSRHAIDDLTVIHKVTSDVSAADESRLFPGQHHGVAHTLQDSDAKGWSRRGWGTNLKLTPHLENWCNGKLKRCTRCDALNSPFTAAQLLYFCSNDLRVLQCPIIGDNRDSCRSTPAVTTCCQTQPNTCATFILTEIEILGDTDTLNVVSLL